MRYNPDDYNMRLTANGWWATCIHCGSGAISYPVPNGKKQVARKRVHHNDDCALMRAANRAVEKR